MDREREVGPAVSRGRRSVCFAENGADKGFGADELSLPLSPSPACAAWPHSPTLLTANDGHVVVERG